MREKRKCEQCETLTINKHLGKIRGKLLCKKCRIEVRKNHREETINSGDIKEDLRILKNKIASENRIKRKKKTIPKIKGSLIKKEKSNSYLTKQDRQDLFRILIKKGLTAEETKERISNLIKQQTKIKKQMEVENKSESKIKIKQQKLLEELWQY